jgi:phospholipid-translocating ATPase
MSHHDDLRNVSMADADSDTDTEPDMDESRIDPELRLRTVRTAASTIAESVRQETKLEKRRRGLRSLRKGKGSTLGGGAWKLSLRKRRADAVSTVGEGEETSTIYSRAGTEMGSSVVGPPGGGGSHARKDSTPSMKGKEKIPMGKRRNIYVNRPLPPHELNQKGEPIVHFTRNKVRTTSESHRYQFILTFISNTTQNTHSSPSSPRTSSNNSADSQTSTSSS